MPFSSLKKIEYILGNTSLFENFKPFGKAYNTFCSIFDCSVLGIENNN